ncbi:MAG: S9 family peptidase [Chloroflexia bacterium]
MANDDSGQAKRPVEINDLYRIRLVGDPQVSPDGETVAFVQTRLRKKKNDYASNIWLAAADGTGEARKFTNSPKRDMVPRWSPKGDEIAFLSTRSGKPQVWVIPVAGGEARQITFAKRGVGEFAWSPGGEWIVFATQVDSELDKKWAEQAKREGKKDGEGGDSENVQPGQAGSGEGATPSLPSAGEWDEDEEEEKDAEDKGDHAYVITRVHIKGEGQGLLLRRTHLHIVPSKGGKAKQLTEGDWDAGSPRWSPDGKQLAYLANREPDAELNSIVDIWVMEIDGDGNKGEERRVTRHDSSVAVMDWLPNAKGFAVFAHSRVKEGALGTNWQVWTIDMDGAITKLTEGLDRTVGSWINSDLWAGNGELRPHFSQDGETIYFMVTNEGNAHIYSVPVAGGEVKTVVGGNRQILSFGVAREGLTFSAAQSGHPVDIFYAPFDGSEERHITRVNRDAEAELDLREAREFWLDRGNGVRVQGWLLMPPGFDPSKKYPLVFQIHGGPHVSYGEAYLHEFQMLAARGYIVMYTNPRGSQGYGQEFSDAILNDWGGVDYDDLMACVDWVVQQGYVDEDRMAVAGGSYGGYMTAWVIGHTQRFKAAVAMRPCVNLYSAWGSGDFTWALWSWEFQGNPRERTELYLERSPITYADEMHTPLLLTHAEDDFRVDIEQSAELYMALRTMGRTVKMIRFPSGGHDISRSGKPSLRIERLEYIAEWIDQYIGVTSDE